MDRKVFTAILLSFVVVGLIVLTFAIFQPFLLALLWGGVLASVTYRAYEWLADRLKYRRLAALAMTVLVLFLIVGPFVALALHFYDDAVHFMDDLGSDALKARIERLEESPTVQRARAWIEEATGEEFDVRARLLALTRVVVGVVAENAPDFAGSVFGLLATLAFIVLSVFYFYRDGPALTRVVQELLPLGEEDRRAIVADIHGAVLAAVRGGLLTALVQGFLGFLILLLLGFSRPVLWACVMALASFIPLIGTSIVWLPLAGVLALDGDAGKAIVLVAYGVLVIGMADNFLRPVLIGQHMEAHPLLLFFGILGGIGMFGFAGIILGPVAVAALNAATRIFRREFAPVEG